MQSSTAPVPVIRPAERFCIGLSRCSSTGLSCSKGDWRPGKRRVIRLSHTKMDLPPKMRQLVKTQNPERGELSHGIVSQAVYQGVQVGLPAAAGRRGFNGRG